MSDGSSYFWIYLSSLGLGLFLSSLIRKRSLFWTGLGLFFVLVSQGGAIISGFYITLFNAKETLLILSLLSVLFFILSLRLTILFPFLIFLFSFYFIYWGSSGIYTLEKGIYPIKIISYPTTNQGRSYNVQYADGRETTLGGAGDYFVLEKAEWNRFLIFLPRKIYPAGFLPFGTEELDGNISLINLTMEKPVLTFRPGLLLNYDLIGPLEDDLFYKWWLTDPDSRSLTSVEPYFNK